MKSQRRVLSRYNTRAVLEKCHSGDTEQTQRGCRENMRGQLTEWNREEKEDGSWTSVVLISCHLGCNINTKAISIIKKIFLTMHILSVLTQLTEKVLLRYASFYL